MRLTRTLKQTCTYWAPGTQDGFGDFTAAAPVQLKCRWEGLTEIEGVTPVRDHVPKNRVFLSTVVAEEGYLALGTISTINPVGVAGASVILRVSEIPNLKATQTLYEVLV